MKNHCLMSIFILLFSFSQGIAQKTFETDTIPTEKENLYITFIGHGTLQFVFNKTVIHIDPVSRYGDYSKLPKADLVLITHHHGDHLDKTALDKTISHNTKIILTEKCFEKINKGIILQNGDSINAKGFFIKAVPAYNILHKRDNGQLFHPKGTGNGYIINIGNKNIYIAGDTENIPEMTGMKEIDIAFLPMNLPYTMTPEMVQNAVRMIQPKILYPYHYGNTNVNALIQLMKENSDCEIRIRNMQ